MCDKKFDYLVVGTGLYGATFARCMTEAGKKVLVIEKKDHIGGNVYTEVQSGIHIHKYGPHIFHTNDKEVWDFVNRFARFNDFVNSPVADYKGERYPLPFNMNTFEKMWGVKDPEEARAIIESQREIKDKVPENLEEQALNLVGRDIYEKLIKGYTKKQWGKECTELPAFLIRRLPVRFTYDNNYYNSEYQGIPVEGYTALVSKMLEGTEVRLNTDFLENRLLSDLAEKTVYTGPIDEYFGYRFGELEYRSLRFETVKEDTEDHQGCAVVNYTDRDTPYTRIIEHKWFTFGKDGEGNPIKGTVITREYPVKFTKGLDPYYPVNDERNEELLKKYMELSESEKNVIFGGRLGEYRYYDMDAVIRAALDMSEKETGHV